MAEPVSLQTLLTYLTLISIPVGVVYHIMTLNNTRKNQQQQLDTRQAQLFMNIYNRFNESDFWKQLYEIRQWEWDGLEEYHEKYESKPEIISKWLAIGSYFEGMGVMVKRNLFDATFIDDLMSGPLMSLWEKWEPTIYEMRRRRKMPTLWEWYEYLYNEVRKISEKEHGAEHVIDTRREWRAPEPIE